LPQVVIEHVGLMPRVAQDPVSVVLHASYAPCFEARIDGRTIVRATVTLSFEASTKRQDNT
jgi:hypothetical protein